MSFINKIKPFAIAGYKNSRILPSIVIAQAILESASGTSELARNANNLFGIKGTYNGKSYSKRTAEQDSKGNVYYVNAPFRKYPSFKESLADHASFFTSTAWRTKNYQPVLKAKDYKTQARALQSTGYATDKQYANKLIKVIEQNRLQKFDKEIGVKMVKRHLIVAGHGGNDVGASGNGINERDFTRNQVVDRVANFINSIDGHEAVVYNKNYNMYWDTSNGGGMYWAEGQFDTVTEFHLDAVNNKTASGAHVIVYNGFIPDSIDLGIRNILRKYVGVRYTHKGHTGISGRNNLLQVNVSAELGVNYRLVELGFITNATDVKNIKNNINAICKGIAEAIAGEKAGQNKTDNKVSDVEDTSPNAKIDRASWGYHWSGTVTALHDIAIYRADQHMNPKYEVKDRLKKGEFLNFDHLFLNKKGYWVGRVKFAQKGSSTDYFFMPLGKKNHGETFEEAIKNGSLWVKVTKLNTNEKTSGVTNWHKKEAVK